MDHQYTHNINNVYKQIDKKQTNKHAPTLLFWQNKHKKKSKVKFTILSIIYDEFCHFM